MRGIVPGHRRGRDLVLAWRRWHVGLAIAIGVLAAARIGGGFEIAAGPMDGPRAQIDRADLGGPVWSLARVGGDRLAMSTTRGDIWLKDLATGLMVRLQEGRGDLVLSLAASPDGRILAVAGGRPEVRLWDVGRGAELERLAIADGRARCVAFSPDGDTLAVGLMSTRDRRAPVTLWEWPGRRRLAALEGHRAGVTAMGFSPDGSRIVSADAEGELMIWNLSAGEPRTLRRARMPKMYAMAFSPDGQSFAMSCYLDNDLRFWDAIEGAPRGMLPDATSTGGPLAFSPDGTLLALSRGEGLSSLRDAATGREVGSVRVPSGHLQAVAFPGNGRVLATGEIDGSVRLWDVGRILDEAARGT